MHGVFDEISELKGERCRREWVACANCNYCFFVCLRQFVKPVCPICGSKDFGSKDFGAVPWWYGREIPDKIHGKVLEDGRRVVPKWFVEVHANIHPVNGDTTLSWLAAKEWFNGQGWEIMDTEEWDSYSERKEKEGQLLFFYKTNINQNHLKV